jgi:hypothetical protein
VKVQEVTVTPGVLEPLHAHRYPNVPHYDSAALMKELSPARLRRIEAAMRMGRWSF